MAGDEQAGTFVLYHYTPSLVAAVIFVVLFAIGSLVHLFFSIHFRARYFIPFIIGSICK